MNNEKFKKVYGLTFDELNQLVISEATKLKANATKDELKRLDFNNLETSHVEKCIYGQMTGHCTSSRAAELIEAGCKRVFTASFGNELVEGVINGSPKKRSRDTYWSPIEVFIDQPRNKENGNNKALVKFLNSKQPKLILL